MIISKEQSNKIQILRGLAILCVIVTHNVPIGLTSVFLRPFSNFAVPLFLFLSGMLSKADNWHPRKRIVKVLIPYAIWTCIYSVLLSIDTPSAIPMKILEGLLIANSVNIMYYIFVYCQLTLLVPLIDKLAQSKYKYLGFLITPAEIILMRLLPLLVGIMPNEYSDAILNASCLGFFAYFYLGYLLGNDLIKIKLTPKTLILLYAASIVLQIGEGYLYYLMGMTNCGTQLKLTALLTSAIGVVLAFKYIKSNVNKDIKPLHLIGDYSFGIYFSHMAIMGGLSRFIPFYETLFFPIKIVIVILVSFGAVFVGRKILGKYAKYLAL